MTVVEYLATGKGVEELVGKSTKSDKKRRLLRMGKVIRWW